jgi:acetyl esterase/lipase
MAALAIGFAGSAGAASANDVVCSPDAPARASVLYFHAGGFVMGQAEDPGNVDICNEFAARGYETRVVEYPLNDLPGAVRAARSAARQHHADFAVGDSAGGTLAALLAVDGTVGGAATFAAPMDLLTWPEDPGRWRPLGASRRERAAASPYRNISRQAAPMLVMHDPGDVVVHFDQATRFVRRLDSARLVRVHGETYGHTWQALHRQEILNWLDARSRAAASGRVRR